MSRSSEHASRAWRGSGRRRRSGERETDDVTSAIPIGMVAGDVIARVDPAARTRLVAGLQQTYGNAHVTRLLQRAPPTAPVEVEGDLVSRLLLLLVPERADPAALVATIELADLAERYHVYQRVALRELIMGRLAGDEAARVRVFGALLTGLHYHPGAESILYGELPHDERVPIDTVVNARLLLETGIGRPLDWSQASDRPLARRWLVLRDQRMDEVYGRPERRRLYEDYLREAIDLLRGVRFGRSTGRGVGPDSDPDQEHYDLALWDEVRDEEVGEATGQEVAMLRLKPGISPALAIDELFAKVDQWAFDCAEFVQVAQLYAQRHALGDTAFDRWVSGARGGAEFLLRNHGSTGLLSDVLFQRDGPDEPMRAYPDQRPVAESVDELLAAAPVGSRIVWRNLAANPSSDAYNENAIKLGSDQFAAHGLGETDQNTFTRAELELELARVTWTLGGDPDTSEIEANVFIRSIQHYIVP